MKQVFQSNDGKIFDSQMECEKHEANNSLALYKFVRDNIESTYNEDAGFDIIERCDIVDFIATHYERIGEILGKTKVVEPEQDEWIINTKTSTGRPSSLSDSCKIKIVYNDGSTDSGYASDWYSRWNTDLGRHIVKYRKITTDHDL